MSAVKMAQGSPDCHLQWSDLRKCHDGKQVRGTAMNDNSSRSHTIVTVTVHTKIAPGDAAPFPQQESALEHEAVLHLVDLAGSESGRVSQC